MLATIAHSPEHAGEGGWGVGGGGGCKQFCLELNAREQDITCLPPEPTKEFHPPTAWTKPMSS